MLSSGGLRLSYCWRPFVEYGKATARPFRFVASRVSLAKEFIDVGVVIRLNGCDAHTETNRQWPVRTRHGSSACLGNQLLGDVQASGEGTVVQNDGELVATDPGNDVAAAQTPTSGRVVTGGIGRRRVCASFRSRGHLCKSRYTHLHEEVAAFTCLLRLRDVGVAAPRPRAEP